MLLGGDYLNWRDFEGEARFNFSAPPIDLFNPSYRGVSAFKSLLDNPDFATSGGPGNTRTEEWYGLYLQDQVKPPYDLQPLLSKMNRGTGQLCVQFSGSGFPEPKKGSKITTEVAKGRSWKFASKRWRRDR